MSYGHNQPSHADSADDLHQELDFLRERVAELENLVVRDGLTPLFNRRHFSELLGAWIARTKRYGGHRALLFIDINQMKAVNDRYGHCTGDRLLRRVGEVLLANTRISDVAARIGGDEFALMLDEIAPDRIDGKIQSLARSIAASWIEIPGGVLHPHCAIGATYLEPNDTQEGALERADRAMYRQKRGSTHERHPE